MERGGLPPWSVAQQWAHGSDKRVPHPDSFAFPGLVNPDLCDRIDRGAPAQDVTDREQQIAIAWIKENVAIYVVNLKWSTARWKAMQERMSTLGLTAERIEGIDLERPGALEQARKDGFVPSDKDFNIEKAWEVGRAMMKKSNPSFGQALLDDWIAIGTIGCAAAHIHAQAEAGKRATLAGKPMALVMEDDIWLSDDFVVKLSRLITGEAPCDWDVIALTSRCPYGTCVSPHRATRELPWGGTVWHVRDVVPSVCKYTRNIRTVTFRFRHTMSASPDLDEGNVAWKTMVSTGDEGRLDDMTCSTT